jgi:hypothetical protein
MAVEGAAAMNPALRTRRFPMQVQDDVRKCVCFVWFKQGGQPKLAGTAFFIGEPVAGTDQSWGCTVTARHVVDAVMGHSDDGKLYLRLNGTSGGITDVETEAADWSTHPSGPSVDVALISFMPEKDKFDHLLASFDQRVDADLVRDEAIGVGDEVFITGLFSNHTGSLRNLPIVRIGNIAAMRRSPSTPSLVPWRRI